MKDNSIFVFITKITFFVRGYDGPMHLKAKENGMQVRSVNKTRPKTLPFLQISFAAFAVNKKNYPNLSKKKICLFKTKKSFLLLNWRTSLYHPAYIHDD